MVGSLNKVVLIGNVGKDPEVRTTQDGKEIVSFSLATSEAWKDKASGERRERTEWHRVVIFSPPLVTIAKNYIHKGSKVYLEGVLQTRKWVDQSSVERYVTEVVLQNFGGTIILLDGKGSGGDYDNQSYHSDKPSSYNQKGSAPEVDDEIPF
ncbi:single-stranded DNA-binding protein [Rickettsiales endosymbiont of Peranema trichophorum]|uniref:single-stranded DNA-binding protein n=1 Tax=Rickettsiales endosymbiont of Peranema trichophorum TaxID=2486577 RepID=UPI001022E9DB|nr:single-stranded DNA-binding protein [Rickettsiales endosymbiont of Peranema trichophorum]RZI47696.1 single-stranded DNA-binding protein [Rickettsiales endosymbiont of Peranema trichophorum]